MSRTTKLAAAVGLALILSGCATTSFISTWKNPEVPPLGKANGRTIIAAVAAADEYIRHDAEDTLAAELTKRGAKGVPSYTLLPPGLKDEAIAKAAFDKSGAVAVVVMRPLATDEQVSVSTTAYMGPYYGGWWGGYWGYGWGYPYGGGSTVSTDTIITVEILFYSLEQNKLVWSGRSKTTNPSNVASFVKELVSSAAWEMNKAGVFK